MRLAALECAHSNVGSLPGEGKENTMSRFPLSVFGVVVKAT